jgi:hypothetical protein
MNFNDKPSHIIIISMIVFIVLNIIENIIYYNNGKYGFDKDIQTYFKIPDWNELIFIVIIMMIFAFAQGVFTVLLSNFY